MIYCILSSYSCSILHVFSFCFGICSNGYVVIFMHRMTFKDIRKHTFLDIQVVLEFFPNYNRTLQAWCDDIVACHIRFIDLLNLLFVNGEDKNFKSMKYNKKPLIFFSFVNTQFIVKPGSVLFWDVLSDYELCVWLVY